MKKTKNILFVLCLIALIFIGSCKGRRDKETLEPIRATQFASDPGAEPLFRKNQILIFYKDAPTPARVNAIRAFITSKGITDSISVRKCNNCSSYAELWEADSIHTTIHGEGIVSGSGRGGSKGVGEDSIAIYSLNFIVRPPVELKELLSANQVLGQARGDRHDPAGESKDTILVAVLDTGIDTSFIVDRGFLWTNKNENGSADTDGNCYAGDQRGWNFVSNNPNIQEDNQNFHGTLVSRYILDALRQNSRNFIQILPLKTHDQNGYGDLFGTVCAIHYAIDKGANIINASWGFYFYEEDPHPYLTDLITKQLADKGILFITAAGNKLDEADAYAKDLYQQTHEVAFPDTLLRNLEFHNFYPACLSARTNNVLTVTTNDEGNVSPTQNFNSAFVDSGVLADTVMPGMMKFRLPFQNANAFISGSSFATAILAGKVAANVPKENYKAGIAKPAILQWLEENAATNSIPLIIIREPSLQQKNRIDQGRYFKKDFINVL